MKTRLIGTLLTGMAILLISLYVGYCLPVKEVWFGHQDSASFYPIATVSEWENKLQSMDWVDSYRMKWMYPANLSLVVDVKSPMAVLASGEYVASDASLFHMPNQVIKVPALDINQAHILDALQLVKNFELYDNIERIQEYSSGAVRAELSSGMVFTLPSMHFHQSIPLLLVMFKDKNKHCNLTHDKYASCY